jgi:hypothetical protein
VDRSENVRGSCNEYDRKTHFYCTLDSRHSGPHVAHDSEQVVLEIWDGDRTYETWPNVEETFGMEGGRW